MPRPSTVSLWIGTRKGAFCFSSKNRKSWDVAGPFFSGEEVQHVAQDPRDPKRFYAAAGNSWFGPHLYTSANRGKTWRLSENAWRSRNFPAPRSSVSGILRRVRPMSPGLSTWAPIPACSIAAPITAPTGNSCPVSAFIPRATNGTPARAA